jgi:hypothetical protein
VRLKCEKLHLLHYHQVKGRGNKNSGAMRAARRRLLAHPNMRSYRPGVTKKWPKQSPKLLGVNNTQPLGGGVSYCSRPLVHQTAINDITGTAA